MNELKLDYTKKGRNSSQIKRLLLLAGVVLIGLSLATMFMVISRDFTKVLMVAAIANALVGITFILQSLEHKIIYPRKFIHVSDETIAFKLGGWFKEQSIPWDSISQVSDEGKSIHIYSGERVSKINMLHFPASDEKRIRSTIKDLAEAKGLH
jgi:hypothetical protein